YPFRHHVGESMDGRLLTEDRFEFLGIHLGDLLHVQVAESLIKFVRAGKGHLRAHLLIEEDADEDGIRVLAKKAIGFRIARRDAFVLRGGYHTVESTPSSLCSSLGCTMLDSSGHSEVARRTRTYELQPCRDGRGRSHRSPNGAIDGGV